MQRLITYTIREFPAETIGILVLSVFVTALEGIGIGMLIPILEGLNAESEFRPSHPLSESIWRIFGMLKIPTTTTMMISVVIFLFLLQAGVKLFQTLIVSWTTAKMEFLLRQRSFASLLSAQLSYFHDKRMGDLANAVVKEVERATSAFIHLTRVLVLALLIIVYLTISLVISWKLALLAGLFGIVLVLLTYRRKTLSNRGIQLRHANEELQSRTIENLIAIREIKVFSIEARVSNSFNSAANYVSQINFLLRRTVALRLAYYELLAMLAVFGILLFSLTLLETGSVLVIAFLAILVRLRSTLIELQNNWDGMVSHLPGLNAVDEAISETTRSHANLESGSTPVTDFRSAVEFKNVNYAYQNETTNALTDINITFQKGQVSAVVGASGAGKSTLVDLIVRFFDPSSGQVLIDGKDLQGLVLSDWRAMIGFVSQETFLFNDTVLANIAIGRPGASRSDIETAAFRAHALEFINELPKGLETEIGDQGVKLSGGQRQRLALARAILRDPPILILDEATSGLDSVSERHVQVSLAEMSKDRTVIVIAHRLSTIRSADKIVVMAKGKVVEEGNHQSLLAQGAHYAEFNELQFGQTV